MCKPFYLSLLIAALMVAANGPSPADAQTQWQAGTGDFLTPGNWTAGVPTTGVAGIINNGGTAQLTDSVLVQMGDILVGSEAGTSGALEISNADVQPLEVAIGNNGTGTLTVNSGYLDSTGSGKTMFIGGHHGAMGEGIMHLNGGHVRSADDFQLGRDGTGSLHMAGGTVRGNFLVVGKFGVGEWNQSGGVVYANNAFEIGDGGNMSSGHVGTPGGRFGTVNYSGGVIQVNGHFAMGNRIGGSEVNISGGGIATTGTRGDGSWFVGRGLDWGGQPSGTGDDQTLRITGDQAVIAIRDDFKMDPENVFQSSTLIAEITGTAHTPILAGRDVDITNGAFAVELNGYTPQTGDSWTILQSGVDLTDAVAAIDAMVTAEGPLDLDFDGDVDGDDKLTHDISNMSGSVIGQFTDFDTSLAALPSGLSWDLAYNATSVVLSVTGTAAGLSGDFNGDNVVDSIDYAVWRENLGQSITLPGEEVTPGQVTQEDFNTWLDNFGASQTPPASTAQATPEPASLMLLLCCVCGAAARSSRKA